MGYCIKGIACVALFLAAFSTQAQSLADVVGKGDTIGTLKLIRSGANVNEADANGSTPLMTACRWADLAMVKLLLANGANANQPRTAKGRTPLMVACAYYSGILITKALVEKGADVNAVANDGTTALMLAAKNAKLDVVEYLLSHGAEPSHKDAAGSTALDQAKLADVSDYLKQSVKDCQLNKDAVIARLTPITH